MEESKGNEVVCKFCDKEFHSCYALRGHMRMHPKKILANSDNPKKNKRLVNRKDKTALKQQEQPVSCTQCCEVFVIFKDLCDHTCHSGQSDSETSSASGSTDQECGAALGLMRWSRVSNSKKGYNLVVNSPAESSDKTSVIMKTKSSSEEQLKIFNIKNQDLDISVEGNAGVGSGIKNSNRVRNTDELKLKEGGSKYDLRRSERALPSYENGANSLETDSLADTNSKIHRSSDRRSTMVNRAGDAKQNNKFHECPNCFKVYTSGQALGGHKRSHKKQEHRIQLQTSIMRNPIDLNLPAASDIDE